MDISQARQLAASIPLDQQAALAAAHERYMYFAGVYTDQPEVDHIAEDWVAFPHLLVFADDGWPSLSDERCAEFMTTVTGLPCEWCSAWEEVEFVTEHGEGFIEKQQRLQASKLLATQHTKQTA